MDRLINSSPLRSSCPPAIAPSRRERRKERTRGALLEAAADLFARAGIYATRVEDITEKADLGKGAFYNYFPSKDALIAELLREAVTQLDERYLALAGAVRSRRSRLCELARQHDRFFDEHPGLIIVFHQARGLLKLSPEPASPLHLAFTEYLRRVGRHFRDSASSLPEVLELDLAAAFVGALAGYRSHCLAAGLRMDREAFAAMLAAGLSPRLHRPDTRKVRGQALGPTASSRRKPVARTKPRRA